MSLLPFISNNVENWHAAKHILTLPHIVQALIISTHKKLDAAFLKHFGKLEWKEQNYTETIFIMQGLDKIGFR